MSILKRYIIIYAMFIKNSIMSQMEYRTNFLVSACVQLAHMGVKLTYVIVLYQAGIDINGFSPDEMMIMIGTYSALSGVFVSFFLLNFDNLSELIRTGGLDTYITKPISLQFLVTLKNVDAAFAFVSLIVGGVMVGVGWSRADIAVNAVNVTGYIGLTLWGLFLTYSIFLIPNIISFWTVSAKGISQFVNQLWDFNNMPMTIYNGAVKILGTFIIPVFLITNTGGLFVMGRMSTELLLWNIAAPVIFFFICRVFWNKAVKRYVSVNG